MKRKETFYACTYCTKISNNIEDFIEVARDVGDLPSLTEYIKEQGLIDVVITDLQNAAQPSLNLTCKQFLESIERDYKEYVLEAIKDLFEYESNYWKDEIEIEIYEET